MGLPQIVQAKLDFGRLRVTSVEQSVCQDNPGFIAARFFVQPLGKRLRLGRDEAAVHEIQPLQWPHSYRAMFGGVIRVRKIEQFKARIYFVPTDQRIKGASLKIVRQSAGWPAETPIQVPRN